LYFIEIRYEGILNLSYAILTKVESLRRKSKEIRNKSIEIYREKYARRSRCHEIFLRGCMHLFLSISCKVLKENLYISRRFPYASVPHVASVASHVQEAQNLLRPVYFEKFKI